MKKALFSVLIGLVMAALVTMQGQAMAEATFVVVLDSAPASLDPHAADSDANLSVAENFFGALVQRVGPEGVIKPSLAERWEHPDQLTWKFYLRKGVKFHNGNPFTADDVKFSFERFNDPKCSGFLYFGKIFDSIDIIDDYTVVLKTKDPNPWFLEALYYKYIMDKESTETRDLGDIGVKPIGTGAYRMVEWVKGSYIKVEANEDYWEGPPAIKKAEFRPITEASTRFAALASGQADLVVGVPVELYEKAVQNPKIKVLTRPARRSIFLLIGNKPGTPTADVRVRKAMYLAINEDEIIQKIMAGHATPAAQLEFPGCPGYNPDLKRFPYNPELAKSLLKEAGYENGFEITLSGPNDRYVQDEKIAEAVAKYLAKVGIKVKLDVKPKSIYFNEVAEGKLEFGLLGWWDWDLGLNYEALLHSRTKGLGGWNGANWSDPTMDLLIEQTLFIVDRYDRIRVLQDLNKLAMIDKIAMIPLHYQEDMYAVQKDRGIQFTPRPGLWIVLKELSISKP